MKPLALLFVCLFVSTRALSAQEATGAHVGNQQAPPGVVLLKLKWSREVAFPRGWDRAPYDASVGSAQSPASSPAAQQRYPVPAGPFPRGGRLPYVYHYTAKIRNDGAKEIRGIIWEYVLTDPGSRKELGRHQFYTSEKISGREQATLRGKSISGPSKVVTARGLEKDGRSPFEEHFAVRCVTYADGSWRRHPSAGESECFSLKRREKPYSRTRTW